MSTTSKVTTLLRGLVVGAVIAPVALWPAPVAATFPGSDGRILFATDRDGNLEIYDMLANGGSPQNVSVNAAFDSSPAISANGKKIVFASIRDR